MLGYLACVSARACVCVCVHASMCVRMPLVCSPCARVCTRRRTQRTTAQIIEAHDLSVEDIVIIGRSGMLVAGPNAEFVMPAALEYISLASREIFISALFTRMVALQARRGPRGWVGVTIGLRVLPRSTRPVPCQRRRVCAERADRAPNESGQCEVNRRDSKHTHADQLVYAGARGCAAHSPHARVRPTALSRSALAMDVSPMITSQPWAAPAGTHTMGMSLSCHVLCDCATRTAAMRCRRVMCRRTWCFSRM